MRKFLVVLWIALAGAVATPAAAQLSFGFSSGGVHLGINIPVYPRLVPVPGYPVYYAPELSQNYFFYDGLYWIYYDDSWYQSEWYNGPWTLVPPDYVPLYVLRVPVRYYRHRPAYFHGWALNSAPRWDEHWGRGWAEQHRDWNRWDRSHAPRPAPLPSYQRSYSGNRYPSYERQHVEHDRNYRYQPRDETVRRQYEQRREQAQRYEAPQRYEQQRGGPDNGKRLGPQGHGPNDNRRGSGIPDTGGG